MKKIQIGNMFEINMEVKYMYHDDEYTEKAYSHLIAFTENMFWDAYRYNREHYPDYAKHIRKFIDDLDAYRKEMEVECDEVQ